MDLSMVIEYVLGVLGWEKKKDESGFSRLKKAKSTFQSPQVIENYTRKQHFVYHCKQRLVWFFLKGWMIY